MFAVLRRGWPQALGAVLGLWLMAAPAVLGYGEPASLVHRVLGPMIAAVSIVALRGHLRGLRWLHPPLGVAVLAGPLVVGGATVALANGAITGLALVGLGVVRGTVAERYGGGWVALWTGDVVPDSTENDQG